MNYLSQIGQNQEGVKIVDGIVKNLKKMWRHRPGNETMGNIEDTIDHIYGDLKPQILKRVVMPHHETYILKLPAGLTFAELKAKQQHFVDATGGEVEIKKHGKRITLEFFNYTLPYKVKFQIDKLDGDLPIFFGFSASGVVVKDLADMINILIAGHPGAGKSNLCHVIAMSLLLTRRIDLNIIDLKKLEFSYLRKYCKLADDLEKAQAMLYEISSELDRRLNLLERAGVVKIKDYEGELPFLVLIIDELAELQDEESQILLNRIVRLGRAAGICVVGSTQRPSAKIFKDFSESKAMFPATCCFHVRDEINSRICLGNDKAATMPFVEGRAIFQWDIETEVQTPYLPISQARKLLKERVIEIEKQELTEGLPTR